MAGGGGGAGRAGVPEILCCGTPAWEATVAVEALPEDGRVDLGPVAARLEAPGTAWGPGGSAAVAAVHLAALGRTVALAGRLGDDEAGRRLLEALARAGVAVLPAPAAGRATKRSAVLVVPGTGRTQFRVEVPPRAVPPLDADDVPGEVLQGARWLQLDRASEAAAALLRRRRGETGLDLHTLPARPEALARLRGMLPSLALLQVRDHAAPGLAALLRGEVLPPAGGGREPPDEDLARAARDLSRAVPRVVVTRGARGALCCAPGEDPREVPPVAPRSLVDPTGAGDAFLAATVDALLRGAPLPEACARGAEAGARACTRLGALPAPATP